MKMLNLWRKKWERQENEKTFYAHGSVESTSWKWPFYPKIDLILIKSPNSFLKMEKHYPNIHMETQNTPDSQNVSQQKEQC